MGNLVKDSRTLLFFTVLLNENKNQCESDDKSLQKVFLKLHEYSKSRSRFPPYLLIQGK